MRTLIDIDPTRRIVYSGRGRVCHGFTFERGSFIIDDFGNSVYADPVQLGHYLDQEH